MIVGLIDRLNQLAAFAREEDRFALRDGVLTGYADAQWRDQAELLPLLRQAVVGCLNSGAGPTTFGIEIGTGSAKLYGMRWPLDATAEPAVDVKLKLRRFNELAEPQTQYRAQIEALASCFGDEIGRRVPPAHIVFEDPARVLDDRHGACANVTYVYGTQGPREAQRRDPQSLPQYLRVLTAEEEARLTFDAIVPPEYATTPGTMTIEIGSGSTELILIDRAGSKRAIAFAINRDNEAVLADLVRGISEGDIVKRAGKHLEVDAAAASSFLTEASAVPRGRLFMNPNRDSEAFRRTVRTRDGRIAVADARAHAGLNEKFSRKARTLVALAEAFGFTEIHEGRKGGLKRAMATFIAAGAFAER